jgi:hypothetical protein
MHGITERVRHDHTTTARWRLPLDNGLPALDRRTGSCNSERHRRWCWGLAATGVARFGSAITMVVAVTYGLARAMTTALAVARGLYLLIRHG